MGYIGSSPELNETVTTSQIVDDAITGAKIADDAIDSEHYANTSIDAGHLASGVGVQGWVKISKTTQTSDATSIDFTSGIDSTYDLYMIALTDVHLDSDDDGGGFDFRMRFYGTTVDGAGWLGEEGTPQSEYHYHSQSSHTGNGNYEALQADDGTYMRLINTQGAATYESLSGTVFIPSPSTTDNRKYAWWTFVGMRDNHSFNMGRGVGGHDACTSAITGVRFFPHTKHIEKGIFTLYGLAN